MQRIYFIQSIYFLFNTLFQILFFVSDFSGQTIAADKQTAHIVVHDSETEIFTLKLLRPKFMNSLLTTQSLSDFLVESVLLIFSVFHVVLLCVFTFLVSCCGVRYDFSLKQCLYLQLLAGVFMSLCGFLCVFVCA